MIPIASRRTSRGWVMLAVLWILLGGFAAHACAANSANITAPGAVAAGSTDSVSNPNALNFVWTLVAGFLVMFMQAGFALVETGMCRAKNAAHTMSMNFLVYALSMTGFFVCGFALMCGGINGIPSGQMTAPIGGPMTLGGCLPLNHMLYVNIAGKPWGLCGLTGFFLGGHSVDPGVCVWFVYMMVFMDTAATIPTGALAERWSFKSFSLFSVCVGGFIYSMYGCWMWGGGWLAQLGQNAHLGHGAVDFAGSSVVHLQGGTLSLVMVYLIGPRIGKYNAAGHPRPIFGHHMPMVMLGTLILAFGWFGFNAGSGLSGSTSRIGVIAVNTMLASGAGSLVACLFMWKLYGKPDPTMMCNGMLGGLVSITAGCAFVTPMMAFLIGGVSGIITVISVLWFERHHIDDPVGAISVHGVGGLWGLLAVGLFADGTYGNGFNGVAGPVTGLFYGDHSKSQLIAQLIAAGTCIAWNVIVGGGVFMLIGRRLGSNRVSPEVEIAGLDIPEMGTPGYPEFITQMSREHVTTADVFDARRR